MAEERVVHVGARGAGKTAAAEKWMREADEAGIRYQVVTGESATFGPMTDIEEDDDVGPLTTARTGQDRP